MEEPKDWMIDELEIVGFKSIVSLNIKPGRVNVFIGKPNAGKSNLLEALTLLGMDVGAAQVIPKDQIRYTDTVSLFYDQSLEFDEGLKSQLMVAIKVGEDQRKSILEPAIKPENFILRLLYGNQSLTGLLTDVFYFISPEGEISGAPIIPPPPPVLNIKKYQFKNIPPDQTNGSLFSLKIDGSNLWKIVRHNAVLKEFANNFFKEYGLNILFDETNNRLDIIKIVRDSYYRIDFSMTPDTFQRMLYYLAAIESNKHSVILFEEPESQSYPPYIQMLAERIIDDAYNQYFITTHSPFIVEKMLERAGNDDDGIKFFVTYFEDYQTKVHELSRKEIDHIIDNSIDLFFNIDSFKK
jgi:AAA15 family ATPase/GTPase